MELKLYEEQYHRPPYRYKLETHHIVGIVINAIVVVLTVFFWIVPFVLMFVAISVSKNRNNPPHIHNQVANWAIWGNFLFGLGWLIGLIVAFSYKERNYQQ